MADATLCARVSHVVGDLLRGRRRDSREVFEEAVVDVPDTYIPRERFEKRDDHGRRPLFGARQGRSSFSTIRVWTYLATRPCHYTSCPHGRDRDRNHACRCPSSRSPHRVRTGSIGWQQNKSLSIEQVNASPWVVRRYYDKVAENEEFGQRRRDASAALELDEEDTAE
jgi:hypothetical protein